MKKIYFLENKLPRVGSDLKIPLYVHLIGLSTILLDAMLHRGSDHIPSP